MRLGHRNMGEKVAKKKKDPLHKAFIQDDNGDVAVGPAETYSAAFKRAADAMASSHRIIKVWTEEVKA